MKTKQVIVIRKDLNMRKGKMASAAAHASMKIFFDMMIDDWGYCDPDPDFILILPEGEIKEEIKNWINGLFIKIVCGCDSLKELEELYNKAKNANLPCSKITDVGLTEFNGVSTVTAIAIGPAASYKIDNITSNLKLL